MSHPKRSSRGRTPETTKILVFNLGIFVRFSGDLLSQITISRQRMLDTVQNIADAWPSDIYIYIYHHHYCYYHYYYFYYCYCCYYFCYFIFYCICIYTNICMYIYTYLFGYHGFTIGLDGADKALVKTGMHI